MQLYRLYILNSRNGRIAHERHLVAKDDATAIWIAEGIRHSRAMELWHGGSKIHAWEALSLRVARSAMPPEESIQIIQTIVN